MLFPDIGNFWILKFKIIKIFLWRFYWGDDIISTILRNKSADMSVYN